MAHPFSAGAARRRDGWAVAWLMALLFLAVAGPVAAEPTATLIIAPDRAAVVRPGVPKQVGELHKGLFLVASRRLADPNFRETVILLVDHGADGTRGLIVNRPTDIPFADALPEVQALKKLKDTVYVGGPVARYLVSLLVRADRPPEDTIQVFGSVYFSHHLGALLRLLDKPQAGVAMRAYVGHAGWAAGQLAVEIQRGDWHIASADADSIFDRATDRVWPTLIDRLDPPLLQAALEPPATRPPAAYP